MKGENVEQMWILEGNTSPPYLSVCIYHTCVLSEPHTHTTQVVSWGNDHTLRHCFQPLHDGLETIPLGSTQQPPEATCRHLQPPVDTCATPPSLSSPPPSPSPSFLSLFPLSSSPPILSLPPPPLTLSLFLHVPTSLSVLLSFFLCLYLFPGPSHSLPPP